MVGQVDGEWEGPWVAELIRAGSGSCREREAAVQIPLVPTLTREWEGPWAAAGGI